MSDTIEPTEAESSVLAELFSTTRRQSNLAILRAHVAAEVAKATGELLKDKERLDYLESEILLERKSGPFWNEFGPSLFRRNMPITRLAIDSVMKDAARAQQKDTP